MAFLNLNINWVYHKWALFYCLVSTIGALCYGYDTIYYTSIQGMKAFIRDYGDLKADGTYALSTTFLSVTASLIYVGEFTGALITAPINDAWGRKAVFLSAPSASSSAPSSSSFQMATIVHSVLAESLLVCELVNSPRVA
jgi:MFS family permease